MGFPRQEYWSGLPFPSPGDLSKAGLKPASPALAGEFFTTEPPGKLHEVSRILIKVPSMKARHSSPMPPLNIKTESKQL